MGRRSKRAPKRGSLAYLPRGRAKRPIGKINYWPEIKLNSPKLLCFAGYKAGMSFVYMTNTRRGTPNFGQEIHRAVSFIEAPPMFVCGIRSYYNTKVGLKSLTETWTNKLPKDLDRLLTLPKEADHSSLNKIQMSLDKASELSAILCTQPRLANVPQKKPELFEAKTAGGTLKDQFEYLNGILGKEIEVSEIFNEGRFVDVIAITKGKGIQGPVKRWGVKKLQHKSRKTVRGVGTLGAWTPHYVMYSVPRAGQMGFHQRTEINKRILKIGKKADRDFPHYGVIRGTYIVLDGSVPGPAKRLIKLRYAVRPPLIKEAELNITYSEVR